MMEGGTGQGSHGTAFDEITVSNALFSELHVDIPYSTLLLMRFRLALIHFSYNLMTGIKGS